MFIDTHAHLNIKEYENDYSAVIDRAFVSGVKGIINVGDDLSTSEKAVEIAKKYDQGVYATVGVHPSHANEKIDFNALTKLAKNKKVIAIGEIGLDYYNSPKNFRGQQAYWDRNSAVAQQELFEKQLKLAIQLSKSVVLHNRDAGEDMLSILMGQSTLPKGVMHCFQENREYASILIEMGFYISFTGLAYL